MPVVLEQIVVAHDGSLPHIPIQIISNKFSFCSEYILICTSQYLFAWSVLWGFILQMYAMSAWYSHQFDDHLYDARILSR